MPQINITIAPREGQQLLLPTGLSTPHALCTRVEVTDRDGSAVPWAPLEEDSTGQAAYVATSGSVPICIQYGFDTGAMPYPGQMFQHRDTRFTRASSDLDRAMQRFAGEPDPALALANHVASLFSYGHPRNRFYDAHDHIPQICGMTEGSCVDINAYFMAGLRAIGVSAGYVTGFFFPEEKTDDMGHGQCEDMHCWVVTRDPWGDRVWDIAHHMKMGRAKITPALNPKPGQRFAMAHSMGLSFPFLGVSDVKLLAEPVWWVDGQFEPAELDIRLRP